MPMNRIVLSAIALSIFLATCAKAEPLLLCGSDKIFLVDTSTAEKGKIEKLWVWDATQHAELSVDVQKTFKATDDCKPIEGGSKILISSSSGGCALVERPSGKVIWYAVAPSAHSLDLLPHDRIVVASSVDHATNQGNRLRLFDIAHSNQPVWETPFDAAHGVVWDEKRQILWGLGYKELRCYELKDWESAKPSLSLKDAYILPHDNGHDLQPMPHSNDLIVSSGQHVYLFDREKREFRLHPALGTRDNIKSVNVHPVTGRTAFIEAVGGKVWWTDTLSFLSPPGKIQFAEERLYKARWMPVQQP